MNTVVREVRSLADTFADASWAMKRCRGEREARIAFATPELLWQVLTAKRWELLNALCGAGRVSIREAARRVGRDVKPVHADVTALLDVGLLNRSPDGGIEFPFQAIKVEFVLRPRSAAITPEDFKVRIRMNLRGASEYPPKLIACLSRYVPLTVLSTLLLRCSLKAAE